MAVRPGSIKEFETCVNLFAEYKNENGAPWNWNGGAPPKLRVVAKYIASTCSKLPAGADKFEVRFKPKNDGRYIKLLVTLEKNAKVLFVAGKDKEALRNIVQPVLADLFQKGRLPGFREATYRLATRAEYGAFKPKPAYASTIFVPDGKLKSKDAFRAWLLQTQQLYTAVPKTERRTRPASGVERYVYRQFPALEKRKFQEFAAAGFDGVIFPLFVEMQMPMGPEVFARSLSNSRGVKTEKGRETKGIVWVNNVEANKPLMYRVGEENKNGGQKILVCSDSKNTNPDPATKGAKVCIDDEHSLDRLLAFYDDAFSKLGKKLKPVKKTLSGAYLDFELSAACTCGKYDAALRKEQVTKLFVGMKNIIAKYLGNGVKVYANTAGLKKAGGTCTATMIPGVDYLKLYSKGVLPAPYFIFYKGREEQAVNEMIKQVKGCFNGIPAHIIIEGYALKNNAVYYCISSETPERVEQLAKEMPAITPVYFEYTRIKNECKPLFASITGTQDLALMQTE